MYSYTLDGKKFLIDSLTTADVMSGELLALDRQYYPPSIAWGKDHWLLQLNSAQYKFALREVTESGKKLLGNLVVCLTAGKRSKDPKKISYYISSLTVDTSYLRQGHAKHLIKVLADRIRSARATTMESDLENICVSVPRNVGLLANIAELYGFQVCAVELNAIRYFSPIAEFLQNIENKSASIKFDSKASYERPEQVKEKVKLRS